MSTHSVGDHWGVGGGWGGRMEEETADRERGKRVQSGRKLSRWLNGGVVMKGAVMTVVEADDDG